MHSLSSVQLSTRVLLHIAVHIVHFPDIEVVEQVVADSLRVA